MKRFWKFPRFLEVVALVGLLVYVTQSWVFVQTLDSIGDEGAYLYKGYMFARGEYQPFQPYAFWTNKSPLAFLIPGYIQLWFGPGLREARYFSIFLGVLMLVAVWLTARRLGGTAWATCAVGVFALFAADIAIYSEAISQVLIGCMMAWMFALTLGERLPLWQLSLGAALSMLMVMTRQNMAVVPLFLVIYIFWSHGRKAGLWALGICAIIFIGFHAFYWPGILHLWAPWLPSSLTPFLNDFRTTLDPSSATDWNVSALSRLQSFATGLSDHFLVIVGSLSAAVLFPRLADWKSSHRFKMAVFLGALYFVLFLMHLQASIFTGYCVYCFSGYQSFYVTAGLFFILVVFINGVAASRLRVVLLQAVLLLSAAGLGLFYYRTWGRWLLEHISLPRINRLFTTGQFRTAPLQEVFTYSLNIEPAPTVHERIAAALGALVIGIMVTLGVWLLYRLWLQKNGASRSAFINLLVACSLIFGTLFPFISSTQALARSKCLAGYLSYYEEAGRTLSQLIPPGSLVYWRGSGKQLALMLYLEDIKIFPPQIHAGGGYRITGDTDRVWRLGLFNQELDEQWRDSADFLVIWEARMSPELRATLQNRQYEEIQYNMGELSKCEDLLHVFRSTQ